MLKWLSKHTWGLLSGLDCPPIFTYMDTGGCEKVKIIFYIIVFFFFFFKWKQHFHKLPVNTFNVCCISAHLKKKKNYSCLFLLYWILFLHLLQQKCQLQALVFTAFLFYFIFLHILSLCSNYLDTEQNCVTELHHCCILINVVVPMLGCVIISSFVFELRVEIIILSHRSRTVYGAKHIMKEVVCLMLFLILNLLYSEVLGITSWCSLRVCELHVCSVHMLSESLSYLCKPEYNLI